MDVTIGRGETTQYPVDKGWPRGAPTSPATYCAVRLETEEATDASESFNAPAGRNEGDKNGRSKDKKHAAEM